MRSESLSETEMSERESIPPGEHVEIDIREAMRQQFSTGRGVLQLQPGMTDEVILQMIKLAISASNGKAFTVIPPLKNPTIS
jgi:hypothetical protein